MRASSLVHALRLSLSLSLVPFLCVPRSDAHTSAAASLTFPPAIQQHLRQIVDHALRPESPGAIVGIWAPGRGTWTYAAGLADVATKQPVHPTDTTRIASITKTFVGTLVLQMVDEGKLSLDAPISRWVPTAPDAPHVTIRELLSHTSGIFDYAEDTGFVQTVLRGVTVQGTHLTYAQHWRPQQFVAIAAKHPLYFPPGTGYHYSNTNFMILGMLLEKLTGRTLPDLLETMILRPLHLMHTHLPAAMGMPRPYMHGYSRLFSKAAVLDVSDQNASWGWAAGGMVSTLADLHVWARVLATGRLLSPAQQQRRLDWTSQSGRSYGMAVANMPSDFIGHVGDMPGYTTAIGYLPKLQATVVVMVNGDQDRSGNDPAFALFKEVVGVPW